MVQYYNSQMESINNVPLLILRQNNKSFKAKQKQLDRRVKNKKLLKEEIYSNHNIFHSNVNLYRNMTAQNIIWDKNYNFKCVINQIKEENSSLKARIWNVEKENRRMERQIEAWNLNETINPNNPKKPYIDTATFEKVIADQDYNVVSMKMQIFELQKQLQQKQQLHSQMIENFKNTPKLISMLNHEISLKKVEVYNSIGEQKNWKNQFERESKQKLSMKIMKQNQHLDLIAKNIEIKKKSKISIERDLETISQECQQQKEVTYAEIQRLKEEVRRMKAQEDGGIGLQREKLGLIKKSVSQYEFSMQIAMDQFIKTKIPLKIQIEELHRKLEIIQNKKISKILND